MKSFPYDLGYTAYCCSLVHTSFPQHTKCMPAWIYIPRNLARNLLVKKSRKIQPQPDSMMPMISSIPETSPLKTSLPPDGTARHGCDIHDMLHSSREAVEWPWNIRPVPSYLVRHSEQVSNTCLVRLPQTNGVGIVDIMVAQKGIV